MAAIDLGHASEAVVLHAVRMAAIAGARLHLVHVLEPVPALFRRAMGAKEAKAFDRTREAAAMERMEAFAEPAGKAGVTVDLVVTEGTPGEEILSEARARRAGLIVCAAARATGALRVIVGTTTDRLIRHSHVPVLAVHAEAPGRLRRIFVPTNIDRADQAALRLATKLACIERGHVSVMHAFAQPSLLHTYLGDTHKFRGDLARSAREKVQQFVAKVKLPPDCAPPHKLVLAADDEVHPAEMIVRTAEVLRMDLIVMGLGEVGFLRREVIGDIAERVLRRLPCSLLALPNAWAEHH